MILKDKNQRNIVKNQHYIPESLIRQFADTENKVVEVLLRTGKIYTTNPSDTMSENFVYEHKNLKANAIESFFSKIESEIVPIVKDIIKKLNINNQEDNIPKIKQDIESILSIFIVFYYRSGALLTEFSSIKNDDKIPLLTKKILNHNYINALAQTIKECYKFTIIESDGDFLLSDQFISTAATGIKTNFFEISNRHIGLRDVLLLIPLSSKYYIVYWDKNCDFLKEDTVVKLSEENIKLINAVIINNSYIKCIGEKQKSIENVLSHYHMISPTQIYAGGNPSGYFCGAILKKEVFLYEEDRQAFSLFESFNFSRYKDLGRNDKCGCGSEKKFKKCHENIYIKILRLIRSIEQQSPAVANRYWVPGAITFERPIDKWEGYSKE